MRQPKKPKGLGDRWPNREQLQILERHAETRPKLRRNAALFVRRMAEGLWWANLQVTRTAEWEAKEARDRIDRETLAEHARQFRDRLRSRLQGENGEIPIWGSKKVDLAAFTADLDVISAGLIEEGKGARERKPGAVWRDELIALVDDTYAKLDDFDSRSAQQHRNATIVHLLNFLGAPAGKHLRTMLRDSRRRRVDPGVGRLEAPLRIVGES